MNWSHCVPLLRVEFVKQFFDNISWSSFHSGKFIHPVCWSSVFILSGVHDAYGQVVSQMEDVVAGPGFLLLLDNRCHFVVKLWCVSDDSWKFLDIHLLHCFFVELVRAIRHGEEHVLVDD